MSLLWLFMAACIAVICVAFGVLGWLAFNLDVHHSEDDQGEAGVSNRPFWKDIPGLGPIFSLILGDQRRITYRRDKRGRFRKVRRG